MAPVQLTGHSTTAFNPATCSMLSYSFFYLYVRTHTRDSKVYDYKDFYQLFLHLCV